MNNNFEQVNKKVLYALINVVDVAKDFCRGNKDKESLINSIVNYDEITMIDRQSNEKVEIEFDVPINTAHEKNNYCGCGCNEHPSKLINIEEIYEVLPPKGQ